MSLLKLVFSRYTGYTYSARIVGENLSATCTAGEEAAAHSVVAKGYGYEASDTLRKAMIKDVKDLLPAGKELGENTAWIFKVSEAKKAAAVSAAKNGGELAVIRQGDLATCNRMHEVIVRKSAEAIRAGDIACHFAVVLGVRLRALRESCPHGQWESFFENARVKGGTNAKHVLHFGFSSQTARNYMNAAEGALARPGLSGAARGRIESFAGGDAVAGNVPAPLVKDLNKATQGETLRQLYLSLGIIRASVAEGNRGNSKPKEEPEYEEEEEEGPELSEGDVVFDGLMVLVDGIDAVVDRGELALLDEGQLRVVSERILKWNGEVRRVGGGGRVK